MSSAIANGAYWVLSPALGDEWQLVWVLDGYFPNSPKRAYVFQSESPYTVNELQGEWLEVQRPACNE